MKILKIQEDNLIMSLYYVRRAGQSLPYHMCGMYKENSGATGKHYHSDAPPNDHHQIDPMREGRKVKCLHCLFWVSLTHRKGSNLPWFFPHFWNLAMVSTRRDLELTLLPTNRVIQRRPSPESIPPMPMPECPGIETTAKCPQQVL